MAFTNYQLLTYYFSPILGLKACFKQTCLINKASDLLMQR